MLTRRAIVTVNQVYLSPLRNSRAFSLKPKIGWDGPVKASVPGQEKGLAKGLGFEPEEPSSWLYKVIPGGLLPAAMVKTGMLSTVGMPAMLGALVFWWYRVRLPIQKFKPFLDLENQTRKLPDGSRISSFLKSDVLQKTAFQNVKTLYDVIRVGAEASKNGDMLGHRVIQDDGTQPYVWLSYKDMIQQSDDLAHAFRKLEIPPGDKTNIGIYCRNRPEWVVVEHAAYAFSNAVVPLYNTLGLGAATYILNQTEAQIVICDSMEKADKILETNVQCPKVKYIAVCDLVDFSDLRKRNFKDHGIQLFSFQELLEIGQAEKRIPHVKPESDTVATICYTSGTTGDPKGVVLTHGNIVADTSVIMCYRHLMDDKDKETMFSFLPMAHMYDRMLQNVMFQLGHRVGYYNGNLLELVNDMQALKPTIMPCVPRVINKVYDKVMAEVNSKWYKRLLFKVAIDYKMRELQAGICRQDSFFDKVVFKKIQNLFGGRMKVVFTGSAPISRNVLSFARCAFGCHIFEGYGQTECVAAATVGTIGDNRPGHVGAPIPCCAVKLVDVPELNYMVKDNKGEVCIRGYNVTPGYYKNPEETKNAIDADGWLHTGDIGLFEEQGTLKIIDRKKHIFKLAQGEYIAPEKIENVYTRSGYISQAYVHGDSLQSTLVAIIVPDPETVTRAAAKKLNLKGLTLEELCQKSEVRNMIKEDMRAMARDSGLHSFEQAKAIYLEIEPFTVENGLLTPTMKTKRPELAKKYAYDIDKMYRRMVKDEKL
ncbi:unnamed protein product [Bursaphelenchus okinawaensis]|uniref:Long-chain-fatty-acid--CoA ligase n=1 Tax=Bursaphelenchus okinawaensis TaxID=465554 RepID=A0A811LRU1_9BILA|nr:unnamed protein product [Bursaphelenchus okinawaensis]CAG9127726.1 unnamed protein product [Bursaphelenchus okinawaensis]